MGFPTVDTFSSLIDEVILSLGASGTVNDQVATLTADISATDTTLALDDSSGVSRGLVEIDQELLYVQAADGVGTVTLAPWGRGYKGSIAASHTAGTPVWIAPTWPRSVVAREINRTIKAVYPGLFAVGTYDFIANGSYQYELPATVDRILSLEWSWTATDGWSPIREWEMVTSANTTDFTTGKSLTLAALYAGCRVHITYAKEPSYLTEETTPFTDTGLSASCHDVIVLGTAARLIPWQDTARTTVETVPSDALDQQRSAGLATQIGQSIRTQYQARLAEERRVLLNRYPTRAHGIR